MAKNAFRKKSAYAEKFVRGVFETNREKVSGWALDNDIWLEVREAGINTDDSEYVTITFNNITKTPDFYLKYKKQKSIV